MYHFWSKEVENCYFLRLKTSITFFFDFEDSKIIIAWKTQKNRQSRKSFQVFGFSSLATFKFGFSTLKLTKINCKSRHFEIFPYFWSFNHPLPITWPIRLYFKKKNGSPHILVDCSWRKGPLCLFCPFWPFFGYFGGL